MRLIPLILTLLFLLFASTMAVKCAQNMADDLDAKISAHLDRSEPGTED